MKVFVATKEGQGTRDSDFTFAEHGELVLFMDGCGSDRGNPDGGCGCGDQCRVFLTDKAPRPLPWRISISILRSMSASTP